MSTTAPPSRPATPAPPALAAEISLLFEHLGVRSVRAALIDMAAMVALKGWAVDESGTSSDSVPAVEGPLDSVFPGASASMAELAMTGVAHVGKLGYTAVKRLSPRRCLFVWRTDADHAMVAEARYHEAPATVGDIDKALVRLLCHIGLDGGQPATPVQVWPPAGAPRLLGIVWPRRAGTLNVALMVLSAVTALWLLLATIPGARQEADALLADNQRLRTLSERTLVRGVSDALASGDYGDVQTALSSFAALGYLDAAAVTNANRRVVAQHGDTNGLVIGAELPVAVAKGSRALALRQGEQKVGELLLIKTAPEASALQAWAALWVLALVSGLAAAGAAARAGRALWQWRR